MRTIHFAPLLLSIALFACDTEEVDSATGATNLTSNNGTNTGNGTGGVGGVTQGDCWQSTWFPSLSADTNNSTYEDPFTSVSCTGSDVRIQSNGIPDFEFVQVTPNDLGAQEWDFTIPGNPQQAGSTSDIPLLGPIGISVNGLPLFGPNEGDFPDPYGDPVYNGIVDFCLGHTAQRGMYHFHAMLEECVHKGYQRAADEPSPVIAFSLDGFPIYGSWGCTDASCSSVVEYQSGWQQTGDPSTYAWDNNTYVGGSDPSILDECNGHVGPNGDYHYHVTADFPYILGCYAGTATDSGMAGPP